MRWQIIPSHYTRSRMCTVHGHGHGHCVPTDAENWLLFFVNKIHFPLNSNKIALCMAEAARATTTFHELRKHTFVWRGNFDVMWFVLTKHKITLTRSPLNWQNSFGNFAVVVGVIVVIQSFHRPTTVHTHCPIALLAISTSTHRT